MSSSHQGGLQGAPPLKWLNPCKTTGTVAVTAPCSLMNTYHPCGAGARGWWEVMGHWSLLGLEAFCWCLTLLQALQERRWEKKQLFFISVNFQLFKFALNWLIYFSVVVEQWQCRQTTVNIKDSHTTSLYLGLQICYAAIWLGSFHLTAWVSFAFIRTLYRCLLMQVLPVLFSFSKKQKSAQILFVKLTRTFWNVVK